MEGWRQIGANLRGKAGDKQDDDQLNWLVNTKFPLTSTGLLMEGAIFVLNE
jgi:hypothetical protein